MAQANESAPDTPAHAPRAPDVRRHLDALESLPAYIEKLERKQRADALSLERKQDRIRELEGQVAQ